MRQEVYRDSHICRYFLVKDSIKSTKNGQTWWERCRCGNNVIIDATFIVEGSNFPRQTRTWFDSDGNMTNITGWGAKLALKQANSNVVI
jgi:hypothetical protein